MRAVWGALAFYLALVVGFAWDPSPLAQGLAGVGIGLAFGHAVLSYGWRDAAVFAGIVLVVSFSLENLSVLTGFPFGHYYFTVGARLPHVGVIPVIVGPLWFGMGYFAWSVARSVLGQRGGLVALPVVAAVVMTAWDVVMDPPSSTIFGAWVWRDGGMDFGVPLSNYAGWLLTSWLFYQSFAGYLAWRRGAAAVRAGQERRLALVAVGFYLAAGLTQVTAWLVAPGGHVTDLSGHVWDEGALRESRVVVMILTMGVFSTLAVRPLTARAGGD